LDLSWIFQISTKTLNYLTKQTKEIGFLERRIRREVINEFIGLKSKLYSINYGEEKTKSKAKGLQKSILKRFVDHKHYKDVIEKTIYFVQTC